jgi:hypothetical protein
MRRKPRAGQLGNASRDDRLGAFSCAGEGRFPDSDSIASMYVSHTSRICGRGSSRQEAGSEARACARDARLRCQRSRRLLSIIAATLVGIAPERLYGWAGASPSSQARIRIAAVLVRRKNLSRSCVVEGALTGEAAQVPGGSPTRWERPHGLTNSSA